MAFEITQGEGGWMISDGASTFGPYSTSLKAADAAHNLDRELAWLRLTPAELVERDHERWARGVQAYSR